MLDVISNDRTPEASPRRSAERTCVGCRSHETKGALVRFAFDGQRLVPDVRARLGGRGVWVHTNRACVRSAVKGGGFAKVLRAQVSFDVDGLVASLEADHAARFISLLGSARRARLAVCGTDECVDLIMRQSAHLAIVAADARSSREVVAEASERAGTPVVVFGTKASLGRSFSKDEVSVVVVTDRSLADSISQVATRIAALSEGE